jgi:CRISPR-associated exonuclease Cas4
MYAESDYLPISALQHWLFCPRQCALIYLEQAWDENRLTAEGRLMHEGVHEAGDESRAGIRIVRGLRIHSRRLGLIGQADVVEFHQCERGVAVPGVEGLWQPYPVEYKRGSPKIDSCDEVQLCAQAMCLEEMLHTSILRGAFYYGKPRRRHAIDLSDSLRQKTQDAAQQVHSLIKSGRTPRASYAKKCDACSLYKRCLPKTTGLAKKIDLYLSKAFELPEGEEML